MADNDSRTEMVVHTAAVGTALGVIGVALAPLAIPFVILTVVFTLPLALPLIPLAVLGAAVVGIWVALRTLVRAVRRPRIGRSAGVAGREQVT
jgi:hypothetical protein